jgi:hypothetical protein
MGRRVAVMAPLLFSLLLLASRCAAAAAPRHDREWGWELEDAGEGEWRPEKELEKEQEEGKQGRGLFVLDRLEKVVESEGGQVRVVRGQPWSPASFACREGLMHVGFITMEPKTLFVPQYLDSNIVLFVRRGMSLNLSFFFCLNLGSSIACSYSRLLAGGILILVA